MKHSRGTLVRIGQARLDFLHKFGLQSEPNPNGIPMPRTIRRRRART